MTTPYLIGITGGSASGKTMFLDRLTERFNKSEVCLISQDNYYKPQKEQPVDPEGVVNYDTPEGIDVQRFLTDLKRLKHGEQVELKEYTFNNEDVEPRLIRLEPAPIILVEGIFVFYFENLREQLDLQVFIDTKEHIKLARRIKRDYEERGYGISDVLYRYQHHVAPTYEQYIAPFKESSDIIVPNNDHFEKAYDVLVGFIEHKLLKEKQADHGS